MTVFSVEGGRKRVRLKKIKTDNNKIKSDSQITISGLADSAATIHVIADNDSTNQLSLAPSEISATVANGQNIAATGCLHLRDHHGINTMHRLPGGKANLWSLPTMAAQGYVFILQNDGASVMVDPNKQAFIMPRTETNNGAEL